MIKVPHELTPQTTGVSIHKLTEIGMLHLVLALSDRFFDKLHRFANVILMSPHNDDIRITMVEFHTKTIGTHLHSAFEVMESYFCLLGNKWRKKIICTTFLVDGGGQIN